MMDYNFIHFINKFYDHYNNLPKSGKPLHNQWTILAAIIMTRNDECEIVSMGTGTKCLSKNAMSFSGKLVNDMHAEIIARRSFLCFIYSEIMKLCMKNESIFEWNINKKKCVLKRNIEFHLITTSLPCGDASIFPKSFSESVDLDNNLKRSYVGIVTSSNKKIKTISQECNEEINHLLLNEDHLDNCIKNTIDFAISNDHEHLTINDNSSKDKLCNTLIKGNLNDNEQALVLDIHRTGAKCLDSSTSKDPLDPGGNYHLVGQLRTKPGRGEKTKSLSCSDKIAKWNVVGIQGALLLLIIDQPIYLKSIIIANKLYCETSLRRAIYDRITPVTNMLHHQFRLNNPYLYLSNLMFCHDKLNYSIDSKPSNSSIIWFDNMSNIGTEVLVNGKKLGVTKKDENNLNSCSVLCKANLLKKFKEAIKNLNDVFSFNTSLFNDSMTYHDFKQSSLQYKICWNNFKEKVFSEWISESFRYEQFK